MKSITYVLALLLGCFAVPVNAQMMMRPPAFASGVPGMAQMQSILQQRHQARTLLYREALEALKKNPAAADLPPCPAGIAVLTEMCMRTPEKVLPPATPIATEVSPPVPTRKIAVLFGNNAYLNPIPSLETPISDVQAIANLLRTRFGYEVRVLTDARKADVASALNQISAEAGPGDSVLVFYAGHGYLMDDTHMGYWIPVDGSTKSPANWVSNTDISKYLKNITAQQVILVSDSCFSGSLTRELKVSTSLSDKSAAATPNRRAVMVMSSGGEEPVSDEGKDGHSIFAWSFLQALGRASEATAGFDLFKLVRKEVVKEYVQQPQYGAALAAGHVEGAEFIFETATLIGHTPVSAHAP